MSLPIMFHRNVGGTRDAYGLDLGMESLSRSPSSIIIWRRSLCGRLGRRGGDDERFPSRWSSLRGEVSGVAARSLMRVGAYADELRLMGVLRAKAFTLIGRVGGRLVPSLGSRQGPVGLLI